jgi:hypothetical protein
MSIEETCSVTRQLVGDLAESAFDLIQAVLDQCRESWRTGTLEEIMTCNSYMMMQFDSQGDVMELLRTATYVKYGSEEVQRAVVRLDEAAKRRKSQGDTFLPRNLADVEYLFQEDVRLVQEGVEDHLEEYHPDVYHRYMERESEGMLVDIDLNDIDPELQGVVLSFRDGKVEVASVEDREWVKEQVREQGHKPGEAHFFLRYPDGTPVPNQPEAKSKPDEGFGLYL